MDLHKHLLLFVLAILIVNAKSKATSSKEDRPEDGVDQGMTDAQIKSRNDEIKNAGFQLAATVAALLSVSNPVTAAAVAIGSIAITALIKDYPMGEGDVWDQLEDRIEIKIGEKMAASKVHDLKEQVLYPINRRLLKNTRFTAEDLEEILDRMPQVIPSNQAIGWNYNLPLAMVYYLPYMIAGYQKMIGEGLQPACALANDMQNYREKVIVGMKEMMRKRYKSIHAKEWDNERVNYKKSRRNITKKGYLIPDHDDTRVSIDNLMTYEDTVTGKEFTLRLRAGSWVGKTWRGEINKIRDKTVDFLYKEVIEKVNTFFTPELCLENLECACPQKITKADITFDYPAQCMGNSKCVHPSGRFKYSYYWCYTARRFTTYIKTGKIDFNSCMPVHEEYIEPFKYLGLKENNYSLMRRSKFSAMDIYSRE